MTAETVNSTTKAKSSAVCSRWSHRWNRQSSPPTARSRGNPLKAYRRNRLNFLIYADFKCLHPETHSQVFQTQYKTPMEPMMWAFVLGHRRICWQGPSELHKITAQDSSKSQRWFRVLKTATSSKCTRKLPTWEAPERKSARRCTSLWRWLSGTPICRSKLVRPMTTPFMRRRRRIKWICKYWGRNIFSLNGERHETI